jgi:hypothetical protein
MLAIRPRTSDLHLHGDGDGDPKSSCFVVARL